MFREFSAKQRQKKMTRRAEERREIIKTLEHLATIDFKKYDTIDINRLPKRKEPKVSLRHYMKFRRQMKYLADIDFDFKKLFYDEKNERPN